MTARQTVEELIWQLCDDGKQTAKYLDTMKAVTDLCMEEVEKAVAVQAEYGWIDHLAVPPPSLADERVDPTPHNAKFLAVIDRLCGDDPDLKTELIAQNCVLVRVAIHNACIDTLMNVRKDVEGGLRSLEGQAPPLRH